MRGGIGTSLRQYLRERHCVAHGEGCNARNEYCFPTGIPGHTDSVPCSMHIVMGGLPPHSVPWCEGAIGGREPRSIAANADIVRGEEGFPIEFDRYGGLRHGHCDAPSR